MRIAILSDVHSNLPALEAGDVRVLISALDVHRRIAAAIDRADRVGRVTERVVLQSVRW